MAVEQNEEEQNSTVNPAPASGTEMPIGTAPGVGAAPTVQSTSSPQKSPQGSGRYANLQRYIQANKGFNTAEQITNPAAQNAQSIRQGIESQKQQVGQQAQNLSNRINTQGQQLQQQAFQDPNAVLNNQDQLQEFQKLRTGGYGSDVGALGANANQYQQQVQNIQDQAQAAGTEAGRFGLLQQRFGTPGYSRGQQRLDQLLLQSTPGAAQNLRSTLQQQAQQTAQAQTGYQNDITAQQAALNPQIQARQDAINKLLQSGNEEGIEGSLGQRGLSDIEGNLTQRLDQMRTDLPETYNQELGNLQSNFQSSLVPLQGRENIYNLNLADYLAPKDVLEGRLSQATAQQLANPEDYARYNALQQLSGGNSQYFGNVDQSQLGKFNPLTYDTEHLNKDLETRKNDVESFTGNLKNLAATGLKDIERMGGGTKPGFGSGFSAIGPSAQVLNASHQVLDQFQKNPSIQNLNAIKTLYQKYNLGNAFSFMGSPLESAMRQIIAKTPEFEAYKPERLYGEGNKKSVALKDGQVASQPIEYIPNKT